jgi:hypothetical protein
MTDQATPPGLSDELEELYSSARHMLAQEKQTWLLRARLFGQEWQLSCRSLLMAILLALMLVVMASGLWLFCNIQAFALASQYFGSLWSPLLVIVLTNLVLIAATWHLMMRALQQVGFQRSWQTLHDREDGDA